MSTITIKDVAARAGVSAKTVSRVINGEAYVRPEKRDLVLRVVSEMDYRPNAFARSLSSSRSYLLGLLIDDPTSGYTAEIQLGALNRCREKSYHLVVEPVERHEPNWTTALAATLDTLRLDGVMLTPPLCDDPVVLATIEAAGISYVRISPDGDDHRSGFVRMDDRAAAADMTRHLIACGHRRIGFIKGHPEHKAASKRHAGFREEMEAAGLAVDERLIVQGDFQFRSGLELAETLLAPPDRPTAIFAGNDDMALGVLMSAVKHGLRVPRDLAIAGFDDAATSRLAWPQITTINQPRAAMAAAAVDILIDPAYRRHADRHAFHRSLDYQLRIRGSTDPAC
jgi:LacI family transcriptional regulator